MKQIDASGILQNLQNKNNYELEKLENEEENSQEVLCDKCLKFGGCGVWKEPAHKLPNGYLVAETTIFCENRKNCIKLGDYRKMIIERNKRNSGLGNLSEKKVSDFKVNNSTQKHMKQIAFNYITNDSDDWVLLCGQSGSGKTHLCSAICNARLDNGRQVKYITYSNLMNITSNYDFTKLDEYKKSKILFLDDLFKTHPTEYERKTVFELIDYRYANNLTTIVSSELSADRFLHLDEAICGRILEKCGSNFMDVPKNTNLNYRLKGE